MIDDKEAKKASLSIGDLSRLTGVNTITLRSWERRHGLLKPGRSDGGHRLYSASDVERIKQVQAWLQKGIAVGKVKPLLNAQPSQEPVGDAFEQQRQNLLKVSSELASQACQQQLLQFSRDLSWASFVHDVLQPVLKQLQHQQAWPALLVLENEVYAWLSWRLRNQHKQKREHSVLLCLGEGTQAWPLLLQAILLLEAGVKVEIISLGQKIEASLALLEQAQQSKLVLYQELKFKAKNLSQLTLQLQQQKNLYVLGGGAFLAELKPKRRVLSDIEQLHSSLF